MISDKIMLPDTINYYPNHLRAMPEFKELAKCFDAMLRLAYQELEHQAADLFYLTLTKDGCELYERVLGIVPQPGATLELRRQAIIAAQFAQPPYTEKRLREVMDSMCGSDGYSLDIQREKCHLRIRIRNRTAESHDALMSDAETVVKQWIPANMTYEVSMFDNHAVSMEGYGGFAVSVAKKYYVNVW